jgi:UDP-N-acetylglucosamine--N-acetylmuramyl-(pentapeptide) pyrophosphoryl-undecaprenol N-acetylglucosamine transferase
MEKKRGCKIVFTGGGSAGHVTPNLAVIEKCKQHKLSPCYIGSKKGIERELVEKINIPYFSIFSGKLRRYFSFANFIDPFKIILGIIQAFFILKKLEPQVVFSKGGFVSFPVVVAAHIMLIRVKSFVVLLTKRRKSFYLLVGAWGRVKLIRLYAHYCRNY